MRMCPNLNDPQVKKEFEELTSVLGEDTAYYMWDRNNGYSLDYTPQGVLSELFSTLLDYYGKDRRKAIIAKAKTLTPSFKKWFGNSKVVDENGEPLVVWHGSNAKFDTFSRDFLGSLTGSGYYIEPDTKRQIPADSERAWFFSDTKDVSVSYAFLGQNKKNSEIAYKIERLVYAINTATAGEFKTVQAFWDAVKDVSEKVPQLAEPLSRLPLIVSSMPEDLRRLFVKDYLVPARKLAFEIADINGRGGLSNWYHNIQRQKQSFNQLIENFDSLRKNDLNALENLVTTRLADWSIYDSDGRIRAYGDNGERVFLDEIKTPELKKDFLSKVKAGIKKSIREFNREAEAGGFIKSTVLYPSYLRLENPLQHDYNYSAFTAKYMVPVPEGTPGSVIYAYDRKGKEVRGRETKYDAAYIAARQVDKAISQGNDGVIYDNIKDPYLGTSYGIFDPNQVKHVDNNGIFAVNDDNIYMYVDINIKPQYSNSYYAGKQCIGTLFTGRIQSAVSVLDNMLNNPLFFDGGQHALGTQLRSKLSEEVSVELVNDVPYLMAYKNGVIYVNIDAFNSYSNYDIANAFLHELLHHFTISEYNHSKAFKENVDSLFEKVKRNTKKDPLYQDRLYYGLTSPLEFIAELYTNPAFRSIVLKNSMSWWRKLLHTLLKALKFNKIADRLIPTEYYKVYNAISDAINNRKLDPDLNDTGDAIFYTLIPDTKWLQDEANKIIKNAINGLKASEKAMNARNASPVQITRARQAVSEYTLMLQQGEDQQTIAKFIERSKTQMEGVLNFLRKAVNNPKLMTNNDLKNLKNDFLDFYGPLCEEISKKLYQQGYFDNLPHDLLDNIEKRLEKINDAYSELSGKYSYLLKQRVIEIVREKGKQYNVPVEDIEAFINDKLNNTPKDINILSRYLQFASNSSDMGIRLMNRMMSDINSEVLWFTNAKTQDLIRGFSTITRAQQLLFFEKDDTGKVTGYLIRPLKYGLFKKDYNEFLTALDLKYGVVDRDYYLLPDAEFSAYCQEKEKWLQDHCERKFVNSYYEEYNKLSKMARLAAKIFTEQITAIIESCTDETGLHLENLTDADWKKLDKLYTEKRRLSNDYYADGTMKQGDDLAIAREFQRFYDSIGQGNIVSQTLSRSEVLALMLRKQKELTPELYDKWVQRNISMQLPQDFIDALQAFGKPDFGAEYDDLYEERRLLLQLGRDNNNPINVAEKYSDSVKERILELDKRIADIRARYGSMDRSFFDIASILPTPQYFRDEKLAKSKGQGVYNAWFAKHHYVDSKGNTRIASYYTRLLPAKDSGFEIEYRLSRMNQELDKNSKMVNKNYDFTDPEYYQPKRSLYDNQEAYDKATETKAQKDVYNLIVDTMDEANQKLSFMSKRDNYRLPQATGDFIDFTMRGGNFFKNFAYMVRDAIVVKNDDTEFAVDNQVTRADGSELLLIPTHYVKMLEHPENISRNLIGLLAEYSRMAENYRLKNRDASTFDIVLNYYNNMSFTKNSMLGSVKKIVPGETSNTANRLKDYLEMLLYGKSTSPWSVEFKKDNKIYSLSITKLIRLVLQYASGSNLGNNLGAIGKSIIQGLDKSIVEGFAGQFYTIEDIGKSYLRLIWRTVPRLFNLGNQYQNDITYALLEHNGIAHDTRSKTEGLQYNRVARLLYKYLVWGGWVATDFMIKGPIVESVYANMKYVPSEGKFMSFPAFRRLYLVSNPDSTIKEARKAFKHLNTPSALDVYTVKDGKLVVRPEYDAYADAVNDKSVQQTLRNVSKVLCGRIDGQISQEEKLMVLQNAIGAAIGMHRNYFVVNMNENLLKGYQYNPLIEDYDEAKFTSGFKGIAKQIFNMFNELRYSGKQNNKNLTNPEYYNARRVLSQISIWGILALMVAIWLRPEADDDKKNYAKQIIGYTIDGARLDEQSEYNPMDLLRQIKTPSAAIAPFENALNLVNPFKFEKNFSTDRIDKGYYKGLHNWLRTLIKATPGLRGFYESSTSTGVRTKWEYQRTQLED